LQTIPQLIVESLTAPREHAFGERLGAKDWRYLSSTQMLARAVAIACAIRNAGATQGDRVALISNNRTDWIAADFGILFAGCVVVPMFATSALDQIDYIFKDSGAKLAFVETQADLERLKAACPNAPRFIRFDGDGPDSLSAFEAEGAALARVVSSLVSSYTDGLQPDELAVLIYTSGTTGNPKGVMLTHGNVVSTSRASFQDASIKAGDVVLSVLPFAHIFEHNDMLGFVQDQCDFYITQPDFLLEDMRSVRPQKMALVPRILERVLAGVIGKAKASGGLQAKLVPWALETGQRYMTKRVDGLPVPFSLGLQFWLAKRLVLSKIPPALGLDRVDYLISGSAPLHRDIALTFAAFGVPICEGYGLTETSPVVTVNRVRSIRYGSVGPPIAGVEIKIAADGEVLVKGPNVMKGYYHLEGAQPFDAEGWFMTGDIGTIDRDGYLYITDRKKELIKTSNGKYVAPSRVEAAIKRSMYVSQVFVVGDGRPFPVGLIAPNWDLLRRQFAIPASASSEEISRRDDVREFVRKQVAASTADLATFEQVRRIALLPRDLTIEAGELSQTLKVKRRVVEQRYADTIAAAYAGASS